MPFAAALSLHPVSAYAAGEVIGQLLEELGPASDLLIVVGRPGHAGALEDIAATVRRLLRPQVLIGGIAEGVGSASTFAETGPALALWAATGARVEPWTPAPASRSAWEVRRDVGRIGERRVTLSERRSVPKPAGGAALVLTAGGPGPLASLAGPAGASSFEVPVIGGVIRGPLILDSEIVATGSVGALVGPELTPRVEAVSDLGAIGPPLMVTASVGDSILELDDQPALDRLTAVVRDHVPAPRLAEIGNELFVAVAVAVVGRGRLPSEAPTRVLGADRRNGAIVIGPGRQALEIGDAIMVHVAAFDNVARSLGVSLGRAGAVDGAILFAAPGHGRQAGAGAGGFADELDGLESDEPLLPEASLVVEAAARYCGRRTGPAGTERASALVSFSEPPPDLP